VRLLPDFVLSPGKRRYRPCGFLAKATKRPLGNPFAQFYCSCLKCRPIISGMRVLWRCVILSAIFTFLLTGLLFFTLGKASSASFVLLLPAIWLTDTILGPAVATSDSGGVNFIHVVLASSVLNIVLYSTAFFLLSKIPVLVQRVKQTKSENGN